MEELTLKTTTSKPIVIESLLGPIVVYFESVTVGKEDQALFRDSCMVCVFLVMCSGKDKGTDIGLDMSSPWP